jgi:putative restriction endonuclease
LARFYLSLDIPREPCIHANWPVTLAAVARDGNNWTRDEHLLAFNLYSKIPFGSIGMRNPQVIELANLLGRRVGAVSYKLTNFARLDPALKARGVRGHSHGAKGEAEIWEEFAEHPEKLTFESERVLAIRSGKTVEETSEIDVRDLPGPGLDRDAIVRLRVNQSFFRKRILSAYDYRCCVTGLTIRPLLVASHIVPWALDKQNRLNPKNGLCLNALHDRAFDRGLMWIDEDLRVRFSMELRQKAVSTGTEWLLSFEGNALTLPRRFAPDAFLLSRHRTSFPRTTARFQTENSELQHR